MSGPELALLVVAGVLAGQTSTIAGLASVVWYPALLLVGGHLTKPGDANNLRGDGYPASFPTWSHSRTAENPP